MALKLDYVVRETGRNLRRNLTLTVASVLTIAVSLSLLGVALLVQKGVSNATARWQDGVEFIVFLQPEISDSQLELVRSDLDEHPEVNRFRFVDQEQAYVEFSEMFRERPEVTASVTADKLPASFRVVPNDPDAGVVSLLVDSFEAKPGVQTVVSATEQIETLQRVTNFIRLAVLGASIVLLFAALLLILNTIRMAMFARRREIEVMKLVGATNWFILVPFMIEGTIAGILGAGMGTGAVYGLNRAFAEWLEDESLNLFSNFAVPSGEVWGIGILLLVIGGLLGAVGSAIAAYRFLDV